MIFLASSCWDISEKSVCNLIRTKATYLSYLVALEHGNVDSAKDNARVLNCFKRLKIQLR